MDSTKHFIIVEIKTDEHCTSEQAEGLVFTWLKNGTLPSGFKPVSVGWIADNLRPAPTGVRSV